MTQTVTHILFCYWYKHFSFGIVNIAFYELLCTGFYYEKMLIIEMLFSFISGIRKSNTLKRKSPMDAYMINHKLISIICRDNFENHGVFTIIEI